MSRVGVRAFAWTGAAAWLESVLAEGSTLHGWSGVRAVESRSGRGRVHVVDAPLAGPDGAERWAVRHYQRGGAVARLLGDRYWGRARARPERELDASVHARARGIRTPAVVAGAMYRSGASGALGFHRADLVTELVPRARSVAEMLLAADASPGALRRAGALARAIHRAGLLHPDLNAENVLLDEGGEAWVLDLDRARRAPGPTTRGAEAMLARLERSLRKLERAGARPLSAEEWEALRSGFEDGERA